MNKLAKNIFYAISIGLSVVLTMWIFIASKSKVGAPVSYGLYTMYILTIMSIIAALMLSVKGLVNKPKSALMSGVGIGVLLLFIIIGYFMDDHEVMPNYTKYGV